MNTDATLQWNNITNQATSPFIINQFGKEYAQDRIKLFQKILAQDYPLKDICNQVKLNMDHSARLQMIHVLFGLSKSDGHIHVEEIKVINRISDYFGISNKDFDSNKAMFVEEIDKYYKILGFRQLIFLVK